MKRMIFLHTNSIFLSLGFSTSALTRVEISSSHSWSTPVGIDTFGAIFVELTQKENFDIKIWNIKILTNVKALDLLYKSYTVGVLMLMKLFNFIWHFVFCLCYLKELFWLEKNAGKSILKRLTKSQLVNIILSIIVTF